MACSFFTAFPPSLSPCALPRRRAHVPRYPLCRSEVSPDVTGPSTSASSSTSSNRSGDDYHTTLQALKSRGRFPRKSFGQHYMVNPSINERLAAVACLEEGDVVLEIGPGTGSLTRVLLEHGATVVAVEKDQHMAMLVRDRFGSTDHLMVLQEDFTKCQIGSYISSILNKQRSTDGSPKLAKVVANIPFNISTDVIKQLLPMGDVFSDVILLLQDETALRWVNGSSRTSEYRPINIFVSFYSDAEYKFRVERKNFFPQPNVDAAVVAFKLKKTTDYPQVTSAKSFFSVFVKEGHRPFFCSVSATSPCYACSQQRGDISEREAASSPTSAGQCMWWTTGIRRLRDRHQQDSNASRSKLTGAWLGGSVQIIKGKLFFHVYWLLLSCLGVRL